MSLEDLCPPAWHSILEDQFGQDYFLGLSSFLEKEMAQCVVYPPENMIFRALELVAPDKVRVVILGQDPYHGPGQANGLAFSVAPDCPLPPSLKNIFKELKNDLGIGPPPNGDLSRWASQGVLLLNNVLTVRAHEANSHQKHGWEQFTASIVKKLNAGSRPLVFVLWGNFAQKKEPLIDVARHRIIMAAHPSPLSARYWFGSRSFSRINAALEELGELPVNW